MTGPDPDRCAGDPPGPPAWLAGERIPIRIFDLDGVRLVIAATDSPGTSAWELQNGESYSADAHADDQVELHAILDSIQFE